MQATDETTRHQFYQSTTVYRVLNTAGSEIPNCLVGEDCSAVRRVRGGSEGAKELGSWRRRGGMRRAKVQGTPRRQRPRWPRGSPDWMGAVAVDCGRRTVLWAAAG